MFINRIISFLGNIKVKTKVILLLLFTAYFSILFVSLAIYKIGADTIDRQIKKELNLTAENTINSINKLVYERLNDMQLLISDSVIADSNSTIDAKTNVLQNSLIKLGWYDDLYFCDPQGTIIVSSNKSALGQSVNNAQWWEQTAENYLYVSDVLSSPFTNKQTLVFANTVTDQENNIIGVLFAEFSWSVIEDMLKHTLPETEVFLIDKNEKVIASKGTELTQKINTLSEIYQTINFEDNIITQIPSSGYLGFSGNNWQLIAQIPKNIAYLPINNFTRLLWISVLIISLIVFIIGHNTAKLLVRPIQILTAGVSKISQGNLNQKIPIHSQDEFGFLAKNFNNMTSTLKEKTNNILEEKGKYKAILESTAAGIILFDTKNKAIAFNETFCQICNQKNSELLHKKARDIFNFLENNNNDLPSQKNIAKIKLIIKNFNFRRWFKGEIIIVNQHYKIYNIFSQPVKTENNTLLGRIWVFNDITEEKEAEKTKNDFISVASHKLRTPLTALNWTLEMIKNNTFGRLAPELENALIQINKHTSRLNSLVKILMNAAEINKNEISITKTIFSLKGTIKKLYQETIAKFCQNQNIHFAIPSDQVLESFKVKADKEKIKLILSMLVENACLYSNNTVKTKVEIQITIPPNSPKVIISVSDTGMGIPIQEQNKIFTKFFRGAEAIKKYTEGTGLSLYLAKIIIASHQEKIWVKSQINQGTTVSFSLNLVS